MATYEMGKLIRTLRKQKRITQEELCDGICSTVTLSRVESGAQTLSKVNFDAIMQRLGENAETYFSAFVGANEFEAFQKREKMQGLLFARKYQEAEKMLEELEKDKEFQEDLNYQFLLRCRASIQVNKEGAEKSETDNYKILELLERAIKISIKKFKLDRIKEYVLTDEEITIINMIAITWSELNDIEKAINILYQLKDSIENSYAAHTEKAAEYTMVLYNLSKYLGLIERYDQTIEICDIAENACLRSNKSAMLPYVIFNKAYAFEKKGDKEPCKRLLYQAYYGFDMMRNFSVAEQVKLYTKEKFGIEL